MGFHPEGNVVLPEPRILRGLRLRFFSHRLGAQSHPQATSNGYMICRRSSHQLDMIQLENNWISPSRKAAQLLRLPLQNLMSTCHKAKGRGYRLK